MFNLCPRLVVSPYIRSLCDYWVCVSFGLASFLLFPSSECRAPDYFHSRFFLFSSRVLFRSNLGFPPTPPCRRIRFPLLPLLHRSFWVALSVSVSFRPSISFVIADRSFHSRFIYSKDGSFIIRCLSVGGCAPMSREAIMTGNSATLAFPFEIWQLAPLLVFHRFGACWGPSAIGHIKKLDRLLQTSMPDWCIQCYFR